MTSRDFCYWLQGFFELTPGAASLAPTQVQQIRNHLALVFKHEIDPSYGGDQEELQAIHDGPAPNQGTVPTWNPHTLIRC